MTPSSCEGSNIWTHCEVSNDGSQVDVGASLTVPGRDQPVEGGSGTRPSGPDRPAPEPSPTEEACTRPDLCTFSYSVVTPPDVTLEDLASFRPATPSLTGQPQGFGIVGMPANIVATASEQQIPGTVLGWDVVVRFVPTAFVFDYGDGTTTRTRTGGATWEALSQQQFTPTATSHVYRARGTYSVAVTVEYAASVNFGARWRPVPGVVSASAGGYDVQVLEARTALVDHTCAETPNGPGC